MKKIILGLAALSAITASPVMAATYVVPTGFDAVEGNSGSRNVLGFINVARLQQVFNASQFLTGPVTLTGVSFRANGASFGGLFSGPGTAFTHTTQGLQIALSTTAASADNLSTSFAANTGSNVINVLPRANVTYGTAANSANGTTKDFDVFLNFVNPFTYDPSKGNLLLDLTNFDGSDSSGTTLDGVNTLGDGTSSLFVSNGTGGTGATSTFGYVTQFTTGTVAGAVPEPASWAMMIVGLGAIGFAMRRKSKVRTMVSYAV